MQATGYQPLNPQVIGQAEAALGALLGPILTDVGCAFEEWVVLALINAGGSPVDRAQLITRVVGARKFAAADVEAAIARLTEDGLLTAGSGPVGLTGAGQDLHKRVHARISEVISGLFDFPAGDLATAGRVLAVVTDRANAFLDSHAAA
ncbi:MAG TPA: hypothetical protein VMA72_04380 [Streptosporangiaceae bacterium]|nr:hypothetical protein [Streptosporangiaceae bacterium]